VQDQLRDLWARPSRLAGWVVVALIHLLMWQVLGRSLNVFEFVPALEPVQVTLLDREPPRAARRNCLDWICHGHWDVCSMPEVNVARECPIVVTSIASGHDPRTS
jgi:hypothetical protein